MVFQTPIFQRESPNYTKATNDHDIDERFEKDFKEAYLTVYSNTLFLKETLNSTTVNITNVLIWPCLTTFH